MFSIIDEGFELYKKELETYLRRVVKLEIAHGPDSMFWGGSTEREISKISIELYGMSKALGLTKEEDDELIEKMKTPIELELQKKRREYEIANHDKIQKAKEILGLI